MTQQTATIMSNPPPLRRLSAALCIAALALGARAATPEDHIETRVSAEVLVRPSAAATESGSLAGSSARLQTAERVVPGDVLIYTVEVRNTGRYAVDSAIVVQPIPNHTLYVADSAVGPGVEVDYSIDGGRSFDKPENLKSSKLAAAVAPDAADAPLAIAAEYTHIRWRLHNRLKPNSIAYVRFRAQVK
jgi:uncharacterized repeat protein (TIGR01451 family)